MAEAYAMIMYVTIILYTAKAVGIITEHAMEATVTEAVHTE